MLNWKTHAHTHICKYIHPYPIFQFFSIWFFSLHQNYLCFEYESIQPGWAASILHRTTIAWRSDFHWHQWLFKNIHLQRLWFTTSALIAHPQSFNC
jgi:hypothetical protein